VREQEGVNILFYREKKGLRYIHPRALYVGFTVRVGAKLGY